MIFEIDGQAYYLEDNYFAPNWWDNWVKRDLKKKSGAQSWRIKQHKENQGDLR